MNILVNTLMNTLIKITMTTLMLTATNSWLPFVKLFEYLN